MKERIVRWEAVREMILESAKDGATIKQIKKALELTVGYVRLRVIHNILTEAGLIRQRNRSWKEGKQVTT